MGKIGTIARRGFILGSATIAGGVAFGAYLYNNPGPNPLSRDLADGAATFNPWVKIDADGVTLIAPHTDLGQGVRSLQAMLIAEEMDLEPGQFTVETGPPDGLYYNSAMGAEMLGPEDKSLVTRFATAAFGTVAREMGMQVTGGSTTAADSYIKLREAGAIARETLKKAASVLNRVPVEQLKTGNGAVIMPDGTEISYVELAAAAAKIDPVKDVTLRDPAQWRFVGKDMKRLDIVGKSTGTLMYGLDQKMDGMVFAAVRLNPNQGAGLANYDDAAARAMPGVVDVIEIDGGLAVVADNSWNAMQAAQAVECYWEKADYLPDMEKQWQAVTDRFEGDAGEPARNDGDVDGALSGGAGIDAEYRAPYLAHAPLEPLSATVLVTDSRADMWVASQVPVFARSFVSGITGHAEADTHIHNQYVGGSFGHRLEFENIKKAAQVGNKMRGTPVKLIYSREEDFAQDFPRPACAARVRASGANGMVEALDITVAGASSSASQGQRAGLPNFGGGDPQLHASISNAPYAIPSMRVRSMVVDRMAPTSSWRSVGASANGFFLESALDEAILAAGGDPMEERLRLCNSPHAKAVLEAVAEMSGWGTELEQGRGRGVAMVHSFGTDVAQVAEVTDTGSGIRIDKLYVAVNVGPVLDPINFDNLVKGGVVFGLGHAMNCETTYTDGQTDQLNFDSFTGMRLHQAPQIFVRAVDTGKGVTGIGEPPVPPAAPALANAIFAATGQRLREMPFSKFVDFV